MQHATNQQQPPSHPATLPGSRAARQTAATQIPPRPKNTQTYFIPSLFLRLETKLLTTKFSFEASKQTLIKVSLFVSRTGGPPKKQQKKLTYFNPSLVRSLKTKLRSTTFSFESSKQTPSKCNIVSCPTAKLKSEMVSLVLSV